jgi:NADPH:quinone reductase-like Zn-dependent oxidoreductase
MSGLGMYAVQFAKALGHPVVAIDNREEGRALATEVPLPADLVIDYNDPDAVSKIKTWAGRDGLAAIIGCTDNQEATSWCLNTLQPHGVCVPVGLPVSDSSTQLKVFGTFANFFGLLSVGRSRIHLLRVQAELLRAGDQRVAGRHEESGGGHDEGRCHAWYQGPCHYCEYGGGCRSAKSVSRSTFERPACLED